MTPQLPEDHLDFLTLSLLTLAAASISFAINIREGLFCQGAILCLSLSVIATSVALFRLPFTSRHSATPIPSLLPTPHSDTPTLRHPDTIPTTLLLLALAFQFLQLHTQYPGSLWNTPPGSLCHQLSIEKDDLTWVRDPIKRAAAKSHIASLESTLADYRFQLGILLAAALTPLALLNRPRLRNSAIALILLTHFLLGASLLRHTPNPFIDVHIFQQESAAALLHGLNPYATTFTNIYGPDAYVYAPNLMTGSRVNFGYPYPPLTLFMALPGYLLAGDHRYSQLAAITLAAALLIYARPSIISTLAALLLLFTPRVFMIVELAWTEPFVVLLLAFTLFCAARFPRLTPYALGLLIASKQYMIFAIPLAALLIPQPFRWKDYLRFILKSALVAAIVSLPLALWDPHAFTFSAVTLQLKQPFRKDSISFLAWLAWYQEPLAIKLSFLAFLAAIATIIIALKRCPPTPAGFALALAAVYLAFLALNKQAFCNYYFLVLAALCSAIAMTPPPPQITNNE